MAIVNYIVLSKRFEEYAAENGLSDREYRLFRVLMDIVNQHSRGSEWPDDFVPVTSEKLKYMMHLHKDDPLYVARESLKRRGLIDFVKGNRNKSAARYKINYFLDVSGGFVPENGGNIGGNIGSKNGGNIGGNIGSINKDYNIDLYSDQTYFEPNGSDRGTDGLCARDASPSDEPLDEFDAALMAAQREATEKYREHYGKDATPAFCIALARCAVLHGMKPGMLDIALSRCARRMPDDPLQYCIAIISNWSKNAVTTPEEHGEYQATYDCATGRVKGLSAEDMLASINELNAQKEARKNRRNGNVQLFQLQN